MMNLKKQIMTALIILFAVQSVQMFAMRKNIQGELTYAVREADYDQVVALVKEGASAEDMGIALNWAIEQPGSEAANKIANYLLFMGASVNAALETAALQGNINICRILIEHGVDADISHRKNPRDQTPLMMPLAGMLSARQKQLVIETLITTIAKKERERIEQQRRGIMEGLMAVKRSEPLPPHDIRKIIARMVIAPFLDEHMAHAQKQLNDIVDLAQSEQSPWRESSYALNIINPIIAPTNWQRLRKEVEANIGRILFNKPAEAE